MNGRDRWKKRVAESVEKHGVHLGVKLEKLSEGEKANWKVEKCSKCVCAVVGPVESAIQWWNRVND